jgi:GAF domain-containing protein
LSLILEKLPCDAGVVHFFDINALEFVVVRAVGRGSGRVLLCRTPEKDPLIARAMSSHRAVVIADAKDDPRLKGERWARLGIPLRSVIVAPVEQAGRFLGLIELVNPRDGGLFTDGDGHGLTYLGEQFAEFLAARGLLLDPARIEKS